MRIDTQPPVQEQHGSNQSVNQSINTSVDPPTKQQHEEPTSGIQTHSVEPTLGGARGVQADRVQPESTTQGEAFVEIHGLAHPVVAIGEAQGLQGSVSAAVAGVAVVAVQGGLTRLAPWRTPTASTPILGHSGMRRSPPFGCSSRGVGSRRVPRPCRWT